MKRHRIMASSAGILAVAMAVAGLVSTTPAQAQTYQYGPGGINPGYNLVVRVTGTRAECTGEFEGPYIASVERPTQDGVTNFIDGCAYHCDVNGDHQIPWGTWVSSKVYTIWHRNGMLWKLDMVAGPIFPTVSITAPSDGATYTAPATVNITTDASDPDGTITKVEFYQGATKLGEDTDSSGGWTYSWTGVAAGAYSLTAKAFDNGGASTISDAVGITVYQTPTSAPVVDNDGGATNIKSDRARLRGTLTAGGSAAVTIYWGTVDGGTNPSAWQHTNSLGTANEGAFFSDVSGLDKNSTYRYRCYAGNVVGTDWADATATFHWSPVEATGGTITYSGDYEIHTFTSSGTFAVTAVGGDIEVLVVGGGGGGGSFAGGGGGGGGIVYTSALEVVAGSSYAVTVGAGGNPSPATGTNGGDSAFGSLVAAGGGGGAGQGSDVGANGGSGGGGQGGTNPYQKPGTNNAALGISPAGLGNKGGEGYQRGGAGGGGGAAAAGAAGTLSAGGNGGQGITNAISGMPVVYGSGGGGGKMVDSGTPGIGGTGAGSGSVGFNNPGLAINATGYGCGGGGSGGIEGQWNSGYPGGSGFQGIVMVRYETSSGGNRAVAFNANGGSGAMSPQSSPVNVAANLSLNTFTRSCYTFAGWNTVAGGGGTAYADGASYSFAASVTLYAQWTAVPTHTVTFNANGGSGAMSPQSSPVNVAANLSLNTFTRSGYAFAGWNTVAGGGGTAYADGASYSFAASITLYAQWTAVPTYTVTYDANGATSGTAPDSQTKTQGVPLTLANNSGNLAKTGYTFGGWNTAANGSGTDYAAGGSYTANAAVTLYAKWSVYRMKITFSGYTNRTEALANFPALVVFDTNLTNFSYDQFLSPNGYDLRFRDAGDTVDLNYEIERWNTGGSSYVWVQVPLIRTNSDYIWASWGDPGASSNRPACTTNGATWDATFAGVWHMKEPNAKDSTSKGLNATASGNTSTSGMIGTGQYFAQGRYAYVLRTPDNPFLDVPKLTISLWMKAPALQGQTYSRMVDRNATGAFAVGRNNNNSTAALWCKGSETDTQGNVFDGTWHHVAFTFNGSTTAAYRDGVLGGTGDPSDGDIPAQTDRLTFGANYGAPAGYCEYYIGVLDEVRLSSVARSSNWVWATYMSMAANTAFNTYGPVFLFNSSGSIADADGDGMDDNWENTYLGGTNASSGTAGEDYDGDGFCDLHEYIAGTNPTNAASVLKVVPVSSPGAASNFVLDWPSVAGKVYSVGWIADLMSPPWQTVASSIAATPPLNVHTISVTGVESGFYRVDVQH